MFVLGACINVLQIVQAETMLTLQLMNLTAITFVVGAVLFTVASIPYLWGIESAGDRVTIYDFLAWQYLVGSILFLAGGIFNYWRAYIVVQRALDARAGGATA
jgi:predicted membrane channel-forming protein YqfA (hemolysin III family)